MSARGGVAVWVSVLCALLCFTLGEAGCRMGGNEYSVGEIWHPRLKSSNSNFCVTCRCVVNESGGYQYDCTSEPCREGCTGDPGQGECCSICSADDASSSSSPLSTTLNGGGSQISGGGGGGGGGLGWSQRVCVVDGMLYNHGDTFSANYSGADNEKCQHCYCNDGVAQCKTKECPAVSCSAPIYTRRDCCRVCPDESTELDWDTMVSFSDPSNPNQRGAGGGRRVGEDCKIGGRYFVNGSVWHPVIGPFGEMDCVLCRCSSGRIDCSRLKCQSRDKLPCSRPVKVAGQCCPICPVTVTGNRPPAAGSSSNLIRCVNTRRSQFAVWKNNGTGTNTGPLHYVFEPLEGSDQPLHLHRMITRSGNLDNLDIYDITREEFNNLSSTYTFELVGGTTTERMNRFKKKERKVERRCSRRQRCSLQMRGMEKGLKIKAPDMRLRCAWGEKEF